MGMPVDTTGEEIRQMQQKAAADRFCGFPQKRPGVFLKCIQKNARSYSDLHCSSIPQSLTCFDQVLIAPSTDRISPVT